MTHHTPRIIDQLAGIDPGSALAATLSNRKEAFANAQESYERLLHPADPGAVSLWERRAVAGFVAAIFGEPETAAHYRALLDKSDPTNGRLAHVVLWEAHDAARPGPYGRFPEGPLTVEDMDGPVYRARPEIREDLGDRLAVALEHAHLLALHPRDASPEDLQWLLDAGWTSAGIVTLSQLVAFLSFQTRVVAGLRAVAAARALAPRTVTA
ncbi:MAG: CMD domain protein [Rhodobacter sp.]|nr:CMD domain protein [Rhodobacter sp.]